MQIIPTDEVLLRMTGAAESELQAALRNLDKKPRHGKHRTVSHLAAACTVARSAVAAIAQAADALRWPMFAAAMRIDELVQACYGRALRQMLSPMPQAEPLTRELMQASAQLFRDICAIYTREIVDPGSASPHEEEGRDPALRLARALWCMSVHAKWTYFMQVGSDPALWRACHALYVRAESLDLAQREICLYRDTHPGMLACADIYVHTLLLGMLNAGNLSAAQIELAHRWIVAFVRGGVKASNVDAARAFHVRLDTELGLEAGMPADGVTTAVRFVDIDPVYARLIESRENLRLGKVDLGDPELQGAVLDYGAFLDLAERFWSPRLKNEQERALRTDAARQTYEVVVGFDRLIDEIADGQTANVGAPNPGIGAAAESGGNVALLHKNQVEPPADLLTCTLKDRSETGAGLLMPEEIAAPPVGALLGFRTSHGGRWNVGVLVRRLAMPETNQTLLGIKGITDQPIAVMLQIGKPAASVPPGGPAESPAVFAPLNGRHSRVDSLILRNITYSRGKDFVVPAGDAKFHVRLNRVLDRGDGWLRAGYQVLGKKQ